MKQNPKQPLKVGGLSAGYTPVEVGSGTYRFTSHVSPYWFSTGDFANALGRAVILKHLALHRHLCLKNHVDSYMEEPKNIVMIPTGLPGRPKPTIPTHPSPGFRPVPGGGDR